MKLHEICEGSLLKKSNHVDKRGVKRDNQEKARLIAAVAKEKSKKANPGDSDTVSGWRGDPHQGGHVMNFINR